MCQCVCDRSFIFQGYILCSRKCFDLFDQFINRCCIQKFCDLFLCEYQCSICFCCHIVFLVIGQISICGSCCHNVFLIFQCQIFHSRKCFDQICHFSGCCLVICFFFQSCEFCFRSGQGIVICYISFFLTAQFIVSLACCRDLCFTLIRQFDGITDLVDLVCNFSCFFPCTRSFVCCFQPLIPCRCITGTAIASVIVLHIRLLGGIIIDIMPDDLITGTYIPVIHSIARVYAVDGIHPAGVFTVVFLSQFKSTAGFRCCDRTDVVLFQSFIRKSGLFQCSLKDLSNGYVIPVKSIGSGCDPCCVSMCNLAVASLYIMFCITDQTEGYFCLRRVC